MGLKNDISRAFKDLSPSSLDETGQKPEQLTDSSRKDSFDIEKAAGEYKMSNPMRQDVSSQISDYSSSTTVPTPGPMAGTGQYSAEPTVVSANTVIKGDIITKDPLTVYGEVEGSVQCENYLSVSGKIRGNTRGDKIVINKASIEGDVVCNNDFFVGEGTEIVGNVSAQSANIHGSVQGNITVKDDVVIGPTALVNGDISTDSIEIKKGAFIKGQIIMQPGENTRMPQRQTVAPSAPRGVAAPSVAPRPAAPPVTAANAPRSSAAAAAVQAAMQSVSAAARATQQKNEGNE